MNRFKNNQRVRVVKPDEEHAQVNGRTGMVVRLRRCDEGAFVKMDEELPEGVGLFPPDDPDGRGRNILLFPDECVEA